MASALQIQGRLPSCCLVRRVPQAHCLSECVGDGSHLMNSRMNYINLIKRIGVRQTALHAQPPRQALRLASDSHCVTTESGACSREKQSIQPGIVVASILLACIMAIVPADVAKAAEYVSPSMEQMQAMAKPFKKQEVNKGRVWLLFVLGASSLFGITVLVENNGAWFPAIAKANKAMKASMKAMEEQEKQVGLTGQAASLSEDSYLPPMVESDDSLQDAVLAGIKQASADAKKTLSAMKDDLTVPQQIGVEDDDIGDMLDISMEEEGFTAKGLDESEETEEEMEETRTPLFEISGDIIDQSIESRVREDKQDTSSDAVDLSNISLDELQKELEKRKNRQI